MKAEFVQPVKVARDVTITLTNDEAQKLRAIIGNIGGDKTEEVNSFLEQFYGILNGLCSKEGKGLTLNGVFNVAGAYKMKFMLR